jgi:hypothetical protein
MPKLKPKLVRCGKTLINPLDVREIKQVKRGLYIVKFISDPNPDYPCWVLEADIEPLIKQFEVIE